MKPFKGSNWQSFLSASRKNRPVLAQNASNKPVEGEREMLIAKERIETITAFHKALAKECIRGLREMWGEDRKTVWCRFSREVLPALLTGHLPAWLLHLDGKLDAYERIESEISREIENPRLKKHFKSCPRCQKEARQIEAESRQGIGLRRNPDFLAAVRQLVEEEEDE